MTGKYLEVVLRDCEEGDTVFCVSVDEIERGMFSSGKSYRVNWDGRIRKDNNLAIGYSNSKFVKESCSPKVTKGGGLSGGVSYTKPTKTRKTSNPLPPKVITVVGSEDTFGRKIEEKITEGYLVHGEVLPTKGSSTSIFYLCQVMVEKEFYYKHFVKNRGYIL